MNRAGIGQTGRFCLYHLVPWMFLALMSGHVAAQDTPLSLDSAMAIAMVNNFDIRIARNVQAQQENLNNAGEAGMLPSIDAGGTYTKSSNSTVQHYSSGLEVKKDRAGSEFVTGDAALSWTIFDGGGMFASRKKLSELSEQGKKSLKIQVENSLQELITGYYSIVQQQQLIKAFEEEIVLDSIRVEISKRKLSNGSGSKLDVLLATTTLNADKSSLMALLSGMKQLHHSLNVIMGRDPDISFTVEDTVIISLQPDLATLRSNLEANNNTLLYYRYSKSISDLGLRQAKARQWPVITLTGNYVYSKTTNDAGFILLNRNLGFNYGVTAALPLFRGFTIRNQIRNARLDVLNASLEYEMKTKEIYSNLIDAYNTFRDNLEILKLEEENIIAAREVLYISSERYKAGLSNSAEQAEAQSTFEQAMQRLTSARFNAKVSETDLIRISGGLIR